MLYQEPIMRHFMAHFISTGSGKYLHEYKGSLPSTQADEAAKTYNNCTPREANWVAA